MITYTNLALWQNEGSQKYTKDNLHEKIHVIKFVVFLDSSLSLPYSQQNQLCIQLISSQKHYIVHAKKGFWENWSCHLIIGGATGLGTWW